MKNSIYVLSIVAFTTLILSNSSVKETAQFVMTVVGEEPVLPEVPYLYNEVEIPEHLLVPNDTIGYISGEIDTTVFPLINNDVATLGRVLFYDTNLSMTQDISCGSCHHQDLSFTDNAIQSEGANMATMRNSMHLNDLGWTNKESFGWDLGQPTLEEILAVPFNDVNELGIDPDDLLAKLNESTFYPDLFDKAFPNQPIETYMVIEALADFIRSMNTFNSKLDQGAINNFADFSTQELEGSEIFRTSCSSCHFQGSINGPDLTIDILFEIMPEMFNNGLDIQNGDTGAGNWQSTFAGLFKAPSLRNIEVTSPYMHDGRFETLDEVIDHYSEGIVQNNWTQGGIFLPPLENFNFTDTEKASLKAFLLTLTDESFLTNPKWSNPFDSSVNNNNIANSIESVVLKPNPMSESALISFNNDNNELVDITIHSNDGKLMQQDQFNGNEYLIQKGDLVPGIYFVKLVMGSKSATCKLVISY